MAQPLPSMWRDSPAHSINAFQPSDITNEALIYSQNHTLVWTGREIKAHPVPDPCHGQLFLFPNGEHQENRLFPFLFLLLTSAFQTKLFLGTSCFLEFNPDDSSILRSLRQSLESLALISCILIILFSYINAPSLFQVDTSPGLPAGWECIIRAAEEKVMTEAVGREPRQDTNGEEEWSL